MKRALVLLLGLICWRVVACRASRAAESSQTPGSLTNVQMFQATGVIREIRPERKSLVIQHDTISNYMEAMTMPFKVKGTNQLAGLHRGDKISFRLLVNDNESWIDNITKASVITKTAAPVPLSPRDRAGERGKGAPERQQSSLSATNRSTSASHPLMSYHFTNEFGQPVTLASFQGQALGITFFFTRCPIPEYCPRLSRNFEEASQKLLTMPNAPTNWHFLSVSIDPQMDTPTVLRTYAHR